jgi:hypothetical protein
MAMKRFRIRRPVAQTKMALSRLGETWAKRGAAKGWLERGGQRLPQPGRDKFCGENVKTRAVGSRQKQ